MKNLFLFLLGITVCSSADFIDPVLDAITFDSLRAYYPEGNNEIYSVKVKYESSGLPDTIFMRDGATHIMKRRYDVSGNISSEEIYNDSNTLIEKKVYRYNSKNLREIILKYDSLNSLPDSSYLQYGTAGLCTLVTTFLSSDSTSFISGHYSYSFDHSNRISRIVYTQSDRFYSSSEDYEYNDFNKIIKKTSYSGSSLGYVDLYE